MVDRTEVTKYASIPPPSPPPITEARRREATKRILRGSTAAGLGLTEDEVGVLVAGIKTLEQLKDLEARAQALVEGTTIMPPLCMSTVHPTANVVNTQCVPLR